MKVIRILFSKVAHYIRGRKLSCYGNNVNIQKGAHLQGNICIGNDVLIGPNDWFISTKAKIIIGDNVVFGPNVTIYTGDHVTDMIGYHISEITDCMKEDTRRVYDKDVIIETGCWIGTRAIILKGVTIGRGSIIGAGAIVAKDVPPYSIYTGVPQKQIAPRFTAEQIERHEHLLKERGKSI